MRNKYGVIIKSKNNNVNILNTNDKMGRILGYHDISPIPRGVKKTYKYDHSDLLKYGKLFVWFGTSYMSGLAGDADLSVNGGIITLTIDGIYPNGLVDIYDDIIRIYYGVY